MSNDAPENTPKNTKRSNEKPFGLVPVLVVARTRDDKTEVVLTPTGDSSRFKKIVPGDWVVVLTRPSHVRVSGGYDRAETSLHPDEQYVASRVEFAPAMDETFVVEGAGLDEIWDIVAKLNRKEAETLT